MTKRAQACTQHRFQNLYRLLDERLLLATMSKTQTSKWDPSEHLDSREGMAAYLEAALEDGDPGVIAAALGDIARFSGMTQLAKDTGLGRESLYKSLSVDGNPELGTILKVVDALGLRLHAIPKDGTKAA